MTPQEEKSLELLRYTIKMSTGAVAIDIESARYLAQLIAHQEADVEIWRKRCSDSDDDYRHELYRASLLEKENKKLKAFKSYFDELYGEGLEIANWHKNGDLEPFDNFYDSAIEEMED